MPLACRNQFICILKAKEVLPLRTLGAAHREHRGKARFAPSSLMVIVSNPFEPDTLFQQQKRVSRKCRSLLKFLTANFKGGKAVAELRILMKMITHSGEIGDRIRAAHAIRSVVMNINDQTHFNLGYQAYLNELTLQGLSPKTVDMYSRFLRQVSVSFDTCPDTLTAAELRATSCLWWKPNQ